MVSTTVLRTTIRIDPFISSIPISARTLGLEHHRLRCWDGHDTRAHPAHPCQFHIDLAAHELRPMPVPAHGPLDPRARHLQDITITQGTARIEPLFERSADPAAVFD